MLIIGISGGTGSGKTTIVKELVKNVSENDISIISQDAYYKKTDDLNIEQKAALNFDHPSAIDFKLLAQHLTLLKKGKTIDQPIYSFNIHNRVKETIRKAPSKVLIIEGILIFNDELIRDLCDIKIFIHTDEHERLSRRIKRDTEERGRNEAEVLNRYKTTLKPMHKTFIEPTKEFADIIIPNNNFNTIAIDMIKTVISKKISSL